jgi:hypothetical protein
LFNIEHVVREIQKNNVQYSATRCTKILRDGQPSTHTLPMIQHTCIYPGCDILVEKHGPYCPGHLQQVHGVNVVRTLLKDQSGKQYGFQGLFTTREFVPEEPILPYVCAEDVLAPDPYDREYDPYLITIRGQRMSALRYRSAASMANSLMRPCRHQCAGTPCMRSTRNNHAEMLDGVLTATQRIPAGAEIYVDYGPSRVEDLRFSVEDVTYGQDGPSVYNL